MQPLPCTVIYPSLKTHAAYHHPLVKTWTETSLGGLYGGLQTCAASWAGWQSASHTHCCEHCHMAPTTTAASCSCRRRCPGLLKASR